MSDTDTTTARPMIDEKDATILLAARTILTELDNGRAILDEDNVSAAHVAGIAKATYEALNILLISAYVRLDLGYCNPNAGREAS